MQKIYGVSFCFILFLFLSQACHTVTNEMGQPGDAEMHVNTHLVSYYHHILESPLCSATRLAVLFCRCILVTASVLSLSPPLADDLWLKLQTPAECSPLFSLSYHCLPCPPCP